jgi:MoxR-like ATPase
MSSLTKLERSHYAVGSSSTKSGISDYLFEYRPRYFIVDEIEKMNKRDQTSLLNLMESGILSELKHNQKRTTQLKPWVFASCNGADNLLPPLLTRFRDIHFSPLPLALVKSNAICCIVLTAALANVYVEL